MAGAWNKGGNFKGQLCILVVTHYVLCLYLCKVCYRRTQWPFLVFFFKFHLYYQHIFLSIFSKHHHKEACEAAVPESCWTRAYYRWEDWYQWAGVCLCTWPSSRTKGKAGLNYFFHSYLSCRASDLKIHLPCSKTYLPSIFVWYCLLPNDK